MRLLMSLVCAASMTVLLGGCTLKEEHVHEHDDGPTRVDRETVVVPQRETVVVPDRDEDDVDVKADVKIDP